MKGLQEVDANNIKTRTPSAPSPCPDPCSLEIHHYLAAGRGWPLRHTSPRPLLALQLLHLIFLLLSSMGLSGLRAGLLAVPLPGCLPGSLPLLLTTRESAPGPSAGAFQRPVQSGSLPFALPLWGTSPARLLHSTLRSLKRSHFTFFWLIVSLPCEKLRSRRARLGTQQSVISVRA